MLQSTPSDYCLLLYGQPVSMEYATMGFVVCELSSSEKILSVSIFMLGVWLFTKRPVSCVTQIYRPLCCWLFGCAGGLVIGMEFGLFELIC